MRVIPDGEALVTFIDGLIWTEPPLNLLLLELHLPKRDGTEILRHPDKHFM